MNDSFFEVKMRKIFTILALLLLSFGLFAEKPAVAVWEIDNKTVGKNKLSQYDVELIADLMRDELIQSNEFRVMSKDEMESAIAQHVKKSHQLNKDKNYAIELGKQISARYVVTSWIKSDGNSFRMFAEITDTETAEAKHSGRAKFVMDDDSKDAAIASLIRQLLGIRDEATRPKKSDDQLACEKARSSRDAAGWIAYKKIHPDGICIEEADRELDKMGCELAKSRNTVEDWEKYLDRHPKGSCSMDAEIAILRLKRQEKSGNDGNSDSNSGYAGSNNASTRDAKACKYAQNENSIEAWQDYLDLFPDGECVMKAKGKIRKLEKERKAKEKKAKERKAKEKQERIATYLKGRKIGNLIWSDRSSNEMNWSSAKQYCKNLTEGGFTDWRLPTISELKTTVQNCQSGGSSCRISNSCLAENCWSESCYCNREARYSKLGDDGEVALWSSSTQSDDTDKAWRVYFLYAEIGIDNKSDDYHVRCVR